MSAQPHGFPIREACGLRISTERGFTFLRDGGEIWFKTDNDDLFLSSKRYFSECGFELTYVTEDLHNSGFEGSLATEHEKMFSEQGIPIKFLIAKKMPIPNEKM